MVVCGGVWWFVVVCGGLRWFAVDCGGLSFSHTPSGNDGSLGERLCQACNDGASSLHR